MAPQPLQPADGDVAAATQQYCRAMTSEMEQMDLPRRAIATQDWESLEKEGDCPCGTPECGHGERCPGAEDEDDPCEGIILHTMRNPSTDTNVSAWSDSLECSHGCNSWDARRELPDQPWGLVLGDGEVEVFPGVTHYELGIYA
jgi:hypothetical protein